MIHTESRASSRLRAGPFLYFRNGGKWIFVCVTVERDLLEGRAGGRRVADRDKLLFARCFFVVCV